MKGTTITIGLLFFSVTVLFATPIIEPRNIVKQARDIVVPPRNIIVSPRNIMIYPINGDLDGDGIPNSRDAFPNNPNEWYDTDHDGIGNNADTDDDGDGMSDAIEKKYHFNPLNAADASTDKDGDGFSNAIEVGLGYNPLSRASHPIWVPLIMGDIMSFIPAKR